MKKGKVWLVGAGPGDIGLFTLKGMEVLQQAEVVVYDSLVGQGVLAKVPTTAFLDRDSVLLQEPVREIFKAHCGVQHIRDLFPQGFLCGFKLLLLGRLSSCGEGCVCKVEFLLPAPPCPILSFAYALFRAVEQIDLVQSGTLAQFHDLDTQMPHGLGCAGVLHAL